MTNTLGMINAFNPANDSKLDEREKAIITRRTKLLGPAYRLFYEHPLHLVRGEGVWLTDSNGKRYLDVYNNVPSVGHCHPQVVEAVSRQMGVLNTHTRYMHESILEYAEMLLETFPSELGQVMFTCTGSEANDLAVRVAKCATSGSGFVVTKLAYHGVTETIAGMSPSLGANVPLNPHVYSVDAPTCATLSRHPDDVATEFSAGVVRALDDMRMKGIKPAALLVDTIFSSDGVFSDPVGFLKPAVQAMRDAGGLFIADEVQAGFGRTGSAFWGFLRHDLVPDMVTMGKPMGNGYPIAAMVAKPELLAEFGRKSRYFNTFGGSTVAVAAARAVLDVIRNEQLMDNAATVGRYLRDGLVELSTRRPLISAVRGAGLFIGVELLKDHSQTEPATRETALVVNGLREKGVLISASGPAANVLKVRPPLPFSQPDADIFLNAFDAVLKSI